MIASYSDNLTPLGDSGIGNASLPSPDHTWETGRGARVCLSPHNLTVSQVIR